MLVFVYDSLKRGYRDHGLLGESQFVCSAKTGINHSLYVANAPYMVEEPGLGVEGEIFEVDEDRLNSIDQFQGHPSLYFRKEITVYTDSGPKRVQAYVHPGPVYGDKQVKY